jgi:hypothetical protein
MQLINLAGRQFNRWTVIKKGTTYILPCGNRVIRWLCQCTCGNFKEVPGVYLRNGMSKSCGCYMIEKATSDNTTHGLSDTKEYYRWYDIHNRCYNKNYYRYKDWGGRGIKICDRWHKDNPNGFLNFYNDIKKLGPKYDDSYSLDRIDNNKDYSPDNIKWSSKREQRLNQQSHRIRFFTYNNETLYLKQWANRFSVDSSDVIYWLKKGKTFSWIYQYYMRTYDRNLYN